MFCSFLAATTNKRLCGARYVALKPKVLFVDEPTRGIDVGAKAEVHHLLRELAATIEQSPGQADTTI